MKFIVIPSEEDRARMRTIFAIEGSTVCSHRRYCQQEAAPSTRELAASRSTHLVGMTGVCSIKDHNYFVYMIASKSRVLYIGMTNNMHRRVWEHKNDLIDGFTREYRCHRLVYYESFDDVTKAIDREKQLKRWNRTKKEWLIVQRNPTWEDLAGEWYERHQFPPEHALEVGTSK